MSRSYEKEKFLFFFYFKKKNQYYSEEKPTFTVIINYLFHLIII